MKKQLTRLLIPLLLVTGCSEDKHQEKLGVTSQPVAQVEAARAGLDSLHRKLWNSILNRIEKTYPLPGSVSWPGLSFESNNYQKEVSNLEVLLHEIRLNRDNEAKACLLLTVHKKILEYSSLAVGSSDPSKIKPEWYAKEIQLTKMGVEIHHAAAPEAIVFFYRGSLGNEIRKIKGTRCSQVYRLYSYQKEHQRAYRNMSIQDWINLEFKNKHHFLAGQGRGKEERALFVLYELSLMLDKWTNCGLFDPTQEEINRFWAQRYKDKEMVKRVISKINELEKHLPDSKDTKKLLHLIGQKLPVDERWPNFCAPEDV